SNNAPAVAGRWGEPEGIPQFIPISNAGISPFNSLAYPTYWYFNPVRAGKSVFAVGLNVTSTNDAVDDDFDGIDPPLGSFPGVTFTLVQDIASMPGTPNNTYIPLNVGSYTATPPNNQFTRAWPEFSNNFDGANQISVASERIRRYVIPQDPAGVGRVVAF